MHLSQLFNIFSICYGINIGLLRHFHLIKNSLSLMGSLFFLACYIWGTSTFGKFYRHGKFAITFAIFFFFFIFLMFFVSRVYWSTSTCHWLEPCVSQLLILFLPAFGQLPRLNSKQMMAGPFFNIFRMSYYNWIYSQRVFFFFGKTKVHTKDQMWTMANSGIVKNNTP